MTPKCVGNQPQTGVNGFIMMMKMLLRDAWYVLETNSFQLC